MVRVLLRHFAALRAQVGTDAEEVEVPADTTAEALVALVAERHPAAAALCRASRVAIGDRFVKGRVELADGDEVALIPPVSGG